VKSENTFRKTSHSSLSKVVDLCTIIQKLITLSKSWILAYWEELTVSLNFRKGISHFHQYWVQRTVYWLVGTLFWLSWLDHRYRPAELLATLTESIEVLFWIHSCCLQSNSAFIIRSVSVQCKVQAYTSPSQFTDDVSV